MGNSHHSSAALGPSKEGGGVVFRLWSAHASAVELCLFDADDLEKERERIPLEPVGDGTWQTLVEDAPAGVAYGYRVFGPWDPARGHRFNPAKLLLDPYARAISGPLRWSDSLRGETGPRDDPRPDTRDSRGAMPRCLLIDEEFDWRGDRRPAVPWRDTMIYECHVKGMTVSHPDVDPAERGRYLGLASEPVIEHLRALGVTTVELMPVHQTFHDQSLCARGLTNYWGYSPIALFAPDERLASGARGQQVTEFKEMVCRLHAAGIEVLLDVVLNHTGEGGSGGPWLCLRGVDNAGYYRLDPNDPRRYVDFSGCGNALNIESPAVRAYLLDVLRYWVREMHVDGFRFDLALALARTEHGVDLPGPLLDEIGADPLLSSVKLVAEPWDLGPYGYALGRFGEPWREWNDRYRQSVRRFWRCDNGVLGEMATRLAGSSDLFEYFGENPLASINYIASHDGFTLLDLTSYERKHNEANGEAERDGADDNASCNWGVEGPTDNPRIRRLRFRLMRNFLATLALSQGVPMIRHGDEIGNSQFGNNNAYCQDNEIGWLDWRLDRDRQRLLDFAREAFALRRRVPWLVRERFFRGKHAESRAATDLVWLHPEGHEMTEAQWSHTAAHVVGMLVQCESLQDEECGAACALLAVLNAGASPTHFVLPALSRLGRWQEVLCSVERRGEAIDDGALRVPEHGVSVLLYLRDES